MIILPIEEIEKGQLQEEKGRKSRENLHEIYRLLLKNSIFNNNYCKRKTHCST